MLKYLKYIAIVALVAANSIFAQQASYTLQNPETGTNKQYVARDFVKLTPGFSYSATQAGQTFNAKIDAGLLFPPTDKTYKAADGTFTTDPTQGAVVGSIPGQFAVSPTGAATYTIPIEVPAGINGMQPSVSLVYNSHLPKGVLGRGFDVACTSSITRVAHNMYYDNGSHTVSFDGNDRFALDGMRLICDNIEDNGADGTIYFTENNQTARITSNGTLGDGPESFIVESPDGKIMEYGSTTDSRMILTSQTGVFIWFLKKITDSFGNEIVYNYTKIGEETVLASITYAAGSVEFSYIDGINGNTVYVNGVGVKSSVFLERIRVKGLTDYLKNYEFNGINSNGQILLTEIKEYVNKNGRNLNEIDSGEEDYFYKNPIKFNWTNTVASTFNNNLFGGTTISRTPFFIDFNGDGYDDVFLIDKTGTAGNEVYTQKIFQNTGIGRTEKFSQDINTDTEIGLLNSQVNSFADINGDSKADLIYKIKSLKTGGGIKYDYNLRVRGLSDEIAYISIYHYTYIDAYDYNFGNTQIRKKEFNVIYGDFDGDAITEILVIQDDNICWLVKYVNGSFIKTAISTNGVNLYSIKDIPTGDFDGDGKMDFGFNINNTFKTYKIINNAFEEIYTFNSTIKYVADINQDGITDLIKFTTTDGNYDDVLQSNVSILNCTVYFRGKNNTFQSKTNELLKGNVFSNYVRENYPNFNAVSNQLTTTELLDVKDVRFEDIDGDGNLNIVLLYDRVLNFDKYFYYGNVSEYMTAESKLVIESFFDNDGLFSDTNRNRTEFSLYMKSSGNIAVGSYINNRFAMNVPSDYYIDMYKGDYQSRYNFTSLSTANINGNGNRTIYKSGTYDNSVSLSFVFHKLDQNIVSNRHIVSSIEDAYGNKTNVNYKISEQAGATQTFPYFTYKAGSPVVNNVIASNTKLNFSSTISYSFTNEVFHRYKGFLGYLNTSITNQDGITQTNTGVLNTTFGIIIPKTETSIAKITTTDVTVVDKLNKRYWIRPEKITEINYLNTTDFLKTIKTFQTYDTNGNPTSIKTEYGDGTGVSSTETFFYTKKGAWYANKPLTYTIVKKSPNVPDYIRKKEYTYYDNGSLKSEISDKDNVDKLQVKNEFEYDTFGNPTKISVTAKDPTTDSDIVRTSTMTYTLNTGRFLETKTNHLGQIVTYHWNEENGTLESEESQSYLGDNQKKSTSYKYDAWGRLIETIYPDGVRNTNVIQWAEPDNALKALYYVYTQTSGTAPVKLWYDALGREVENESYGLNGKKISVFTQYYPDGRVKQISEPTFNPNEIVWAQSEINYNSDPFKRVSSVKTPTGTVTKTYGKTSTEIFTATTENGVKTRTKETTINNAGQKISSKVNGKEVVYTYYASGLPKTSTPVEGIALTMVYDIQGNRISINDPNAGVVLSKYNGFGELIEEKQKLHDNNNYITTTNTYKTNGLLDKIVRNTTETTTYTYDSKNRISKIEISATNKQEFTYDKLDRITAIRETVGTMTFDHETVYDFYGRVQKEIFPTGYYTQNKYDEYSNLTEVTDKSGRSIWKVIDENARRQVTNINKGGKITSYGFDKETGFPTSISAPEVINYSYVINNLGNLIERNDNNKTQKEKFIYDDQDRLTNWNVYHNITTLVKSNSIVYNPATSNISTKSDLGPLTLGYGGSRPDGTPIGPHALTSISGVPANFPQRTDAFPFANLDVTYTDFKKIKKLSELGKTYELSYGVDDHRRKSIYKENDVTKHTRYYLGNYEEEHDAFGNVKQIHYLSGAIMIRENGVETLYYTYADYQGSLLALTNADGTVVERYAYDPWGARRNPDDWTLAATPPSGGWGALIVNRGYTGHEHLDQFGIINMNGRVYDPLTAQFFSPDPFIQAPDNWLNYNRYSYCFGNPFKYTDPSGEVVFTLIAVFFCPALLPYAIAADIAWMSDYASQVSTNLINGYTGSDAFFKRIDYFDLGINAIAGGLSVIPGLGWINYAAPSITNAVNLRFDGSVETIFGGNEKGGTIEFGKYLGSTVLEVSAIGMTDVVKNTAGKNFTKGYASDLPKRTLDRMTKKELWNLSSKELFRNWAFDGTGSLMGKFSQEGFVNEYEKMNGKQNPATPFRPILYTPHTFFNTKLINESYNNSDYVNIFNISLSIR